MFRLNSQFHKLYSVNNKNTKRSVSNIVDLEGTYSAFKPENRHFSPFYGVVNIKTKSIQRHYEAIQKNKADKKNEEEFTATEWLIDSLFNKLGSEFRATNNKTLPAYSLSPALLAEVLYYLDQKKMSNPEIQKEICNKWKLAHRIETTSKLSAGNLQNLINDIITSKHECAKGMYPEKYTETLLLAFLFLKSKSRKDFIEYMTTLKSLGIILSEFQDTTIESTLLLKKGKQALDAINSENLKQYGFNLEKNYELILLYILSGLDRTAMSAYSYHRKLPVNNCVEMVFHNICNIFLYNQESNKFDFSILPTTLHPNPMLKYFYEMQNYNVHTVNSPEIGEAFFYFLSGNKDFIYVEGDHELETTPLNFLPIMNFLFGINASSFTELSQLFSNEERQFIFENKGQNIDIVISDAETRKEHEITITFTDKHADISTNFFKNNDIIFSGKFHGIALKEFSKNPLLLLAMHGVHNINAEISENDLYRILMNHLSQNNLLEIIYYFTISPRNTNNAMALLSKIFANIDNNPHWETFINYLVNNEYHNEYELALFAVNRNDFKMVEGLIKRGLDVNKKFSISPYGNTCLIQHATEPAIINLLLNAGAKMPSRGKQNQVWIYSEGYDVFPSKPGQTNTQYQLGFFGNSVANAKNPDCQTQESVADSRSHISLMPNKCRE